MYLIDVVGGVAAKIRTLQLTFTVPLKMTVVRPLHSGCWH